MQAPERGPKPAERGAHHRTAIAEALQRGLQVEATYLSTLTGESPARSEHAWRGAQSERLAW